MKVLMVCLGNICRSPLAEGILQSYIDQHNLDWEVDSSGTSSYHLGSLPDRRSIAVAKAHGIDITNQKARQFVVNDFDRFDQIFVMDSSNYQNVQRLARNKNDKSKIDLIMNQAYENQNRAVPDPYWDDNGFEQVYQMLDKAVQIFLQKNNAI